MLIELLAVAALAHQGSAPTPPPALVVNPQWDEAPTPSWPRDASRWVNSGEVVMNCAAGADGRISDCHVVSESPGRYGFAREVRYSIEPARLANPEQYGPGARISFKTRFSTLDRYGVKIVVAGEDD